jgi:iron complex transport system permease protein
MTGDLGAAAANALAGHRRRTHTRLVILCLLAAATLGAFLLDIVTGPSSLSAGDAIRGILAPGGLGRSATVIIWDVRLPQALMAVLVGIALSLAGAEMQTTLNNSLASPFTLGLSSAATFGAALAIILGIGIPGVPQTWIVSANAFALAFATAMLLQLLARLRGSGGETLVLFGIALFFTFNALIAIMQFIASEQALQQLVFWTLGSLTRSNQEKIWILLVVIACILPLSFASSWQLTALRLGSDRARSFGVDVVRLRFFSLLRVSVLTGTAVAFVGTIAFIGLVGPHIARLLIGEDHRFFLPGSALAGALVMSLASCLSKTIVPGIVLPIGLVTSLIGVPFFLALVLLRRERG